MANLIEGLHEEMNRCRELLTQYEAIGTDGMFGAIMIKQGIKNAENTIATGDVVAMLKSYAELKDME